MTTTRGRVYQARIDVTPPLSRRPVYISGGWRFEIYNHGRLITWGRHYPTQQEALTRCCATLASIKDTSTANPQHQTSQQLRRFAYQRPLPTDHNG